MTSEDETDKTSSKIFDLPLYVLRILLSYLDATSLYMLSQTCTYFKECVEDPALWKYVDTRAAPNSNVKLSYCTQRINEKTSHFFIRGVGQQVPMNFFEKINPYKNLRVLSLENQRINASLVSLKDFPTALEELSLKKTTLKAKNSACFFRYSFPNFPKLKVLILDECNWLNCSFLISVSKYENLEIVSVAKCPRVHIQTVPYLNVAKYGCKKLKVFDCRFTGIGGELLRTFYAKESIQKFYFQSFNSAEVDYNANFTGNSKTLPRMLEHNLDITISDSSLHDYPSTIPADTIDPIFDSVLYKDPYPDCTCGYKDLIDLTPDARTVTNVKLLEDDFVNHISSRQTTKFVCKKHMKDVSRLPNDFRDFFVSHQRQFHSDFNSDIDTDSDSSDSDGDGNGAGNCCIFAMGSRMVMIPNVNEPSRREEITLPGVTSGRSDMPLNIFIVRPLGERENETPDTNRVSDDGPSTSRDSLDTFCESLENSRMETECNGSTDRKPAENDTVANSGGSRKLNEVKRKCSTSDDSDSEPSKKQKLEKVPPICFASESQQVKELVKSFAETAGKIRDALEKKMKSTRSSNTFCIRREQRHKSLHSDVSSPSTSSQSSGVSHNYSNEHISTFRVNTKSQSDSSSIPVGTNTVQNNSGASNDQDISRPTTSHSRNNEPSVSSRGSSLNVRLEPEVGVRPRYCRATVLSGPYYNQYPPNRPFLRYQLPVNEHWLLSTKKISLRCLSLRGYRRISDVTLKNLKHLHIELLDLTYTNVTKNGIEDFLLDNPNCRIIHHLYCICRPTSPF